MFNFPFSFFSLEVIVSNVVNLIYSSNGDTNGLVYYLGTNKLTTTFATTVFLRMDASATSSANPVSVLINRIDDTWFTVNAGNQWARLTLLNNSLKVNRYSLKTRSDSTANLPINFKLQGSTDLMTWVDLDIKVNQTSINAANTWYSFPITTNNSYRSFRIITTVADQTGTHSLYLNELEFYGELQEYQAGATVSIPFDSLGGNDVIYYLGTNKLTTTFSNPTTAQIMAVTASTIGAGTTDLLTNRSNSAFNTTNVADSSITFDFLVVRVRPNQYVLQTRSSSGIYPRNWKLQGSNDNSTWTDLDTRTSNTSLNAINQRIAFSCTSALFYRFIRILQTGVNSSGSNFLGLGEFYIYGDISI